jgi:hypothetical protein
MKRPNQYNIWSQGKRERPNQKTYEVKKGKRKDQINTTYEVNEKGKENEKTNST